MKHNMLIQNISLFRNIEATTMQLLLKKGRIVEVSKGTQLIREREPSGNLYFQLSGKSIVYNLTTNGKRKILFVFGYGALLNGNLFNTRSSSNYCETIENSQLFVVSIQDFSKLMAMDFQLTRNLVEAQEHKMWRLSHQLKNTTSGISMEKKLVFKLKKLARDFGVETEKGVEIDMQLSITFLADMLGAPRETTSRICSSLVEKGMISIERKRVTIMDKGMALKH
jgi:CRP-like cAMP-binding protein